MDLFADRTCRRFVEIEVGLIGICVERKGLAPQNEPLAGAAAESMASALLS
jgi:hypothetical protein